jgi:molybdopterin/thiamine biosynthesis adenylyltransferase
MANPQPLNDDDRARYEWQLNVDGFGESGQQRLKNASVLVSRVGGVGGVVAHQLAAAGVGRLVLAHGGPLRINDLNRQLLMSHAGLGESRVRQAAERLRAFNPSLEVVAVEENIGPDNADALVAQVDFVACCAPLFQERLLMNAAAVKQRKPLIDCAMYELEAQLTMVLPGLSPCLACLYPEPPHAWKRQFPVFGAVAGTVGSLGAMEIIKHLAGFGDPLAGRMLIADLRDLSFRTLKLRRDPACVVCSST